MRIKLNKPKSMLFYIVKLITVKWDCINRKSTFCAIESQVETRDLQDMFSDQIINVPPFLDLVHA